MEVVPVTIFDIAAKLGLKVVEDLGTFGHSHIARTAGGVMIKSLEPETLDGLYGDNREGMAQHIAETSTAYYRALAETGVTVPPQYNVEILRNGKATRVVAITTDMGPDCKTLMLRYPDDRKWYYVAQMLGSVEAVAHRDDLGIDPHPPNYAGEGVAQVDFFQVQMIHNGRQLVGFPTPEDPAVREYSWRRYCTFEGTIRLLRFNVLRLNPGCPEWENAFYETMRWNLNPDLTKRAIELFETLPEREAQKLIQRGKRNEAKKLISGLDMFHTDDLREIALTLAPNSAALDRLFPLSRLDFRAPANTRQERLGQFKTKLCHLVDAMASL